eukprot:scaffold18281_cov78-Phaeocystis_antarctica.AAC.1
MQCVYPMNACGACRSCATALWASTPGALRYPRRPRPRAAAASSASDAAATVTAACAVGATSASRSRPSGAKSSAIGARAWRAPAAAHLDLDGRVLPDTPARKRRLTLEPLATVVQLEVVRREPGAVAEGLVQEGSRQVQRGVDHDGLALFEFHLHLLVDVGPVSDTWSVRLLVSRVGRVVSAPAPSDQDRTRSRPPCRPCSPTSPPAGLVRRRYGARSR